MTTRAPAVLKISASHLYICKICWNIKLSIPNYIRGCVQPLWIWYGWISLTNLLLRYFWYSQVSSGVPFETRQPSDPGLQWLHHWGDGTRTTQVIPKIFVCNSSYQTSHKIWRWFPKYSCGWTFSVDSKLYPKPQTLSCKWLVSRINR